MYVLIMSRTRFKVNLHTIVAGMSRNSLLETGTYTHTLIKKGTLINTRNKTYRMLTLIGTII